MPQPKPDDLSTRLNRKVSNYSLAKNNLIGALIRVSNDFQIPMGIAWIDTPATIAQRPFAWKSATVWQIIESIAEAEPGYRIETTNGVMHIFPAALIPDRQNFLKIKITTFETHNAIVELASFKLHSLVTPTKGNHQFSIAGTGDSQISVKLKNCTVEDALDALAVASNRKIWVVTFSDDPGLTNRGLRRAVSLWSGKPGPDDGQPAWDLLRWGDPEPPVVSGTSTP
jgi:hypothetical protein